MASDVARACDEALGIDAPRIRTAERDRRMWAELKARAGNSTTKLDRRMWAGLQDDG